ncbi:meiotic nuclear division protein 1 homolog [Lingula anatina]|uniref:Meiotic nuclear division protein 1 homolog n=1 Tax=Lingula anatina TaxID=7574 RepID=A0A1S3JA61_LINAN|nr:meiotic nuclear division protein 1 homolog [Lingula anatina]|eukprot:XP_013406769.1 meiotic nuclear division protein 1 homolog [Lingula anatina]
MSKKRGLSLEEKRTRMMEFFFEKKDCFQLKELEKQCQKEKGITSMSVKDVLTSLVDDALVDTDKIGTSVYFWAFPSKASQNRKRKLNDLGKNLEELKRKKSNLANAICKAKMGKEESADRTQVLADLSRAEDERDKLRLEVDKYKECDPEVLEAMKKEALIAKEAANRWTDNIFATKSWIKRKFAFEDSVIDKQFGIPEDFDYLE